MDNFDIDDFTVDAKHTDGDEIDIDSLLDIDDNDNDDNTDDIDIDSLLDNNDNGNSDNDLTDLLEDTDDILGLDDLDLGLDDLLEDIPTIEVTKNHLLTEDTIPTEVLMESCNMLQILKYYEYGYYKKVESQLASEEIQEKLNNKTLESRIVATNITVDDLRQKGITRCTLISAKSVFQEILGENGAKGLEIIQDIERDLADSEDSFEAQEHILLKNLSNLTNSYFEVKNIIEDIRKEFLQILREESIIDEKYQDYLKQNPEIIECKNNVFNDYKITRLPPVGFDYLLSNDLNYQIDVNTRNDIIKTTLLNKYSKEDDIGMDGLIKLDFLNKYSSNFLTKIAVKYHENKSSVSTVIEGDVLTEKDLTCFNKDDYEMLIRDRDMRKILESLLNEHIQETAKYTIALRDNNNYSTNIIPKRRVIVANNISFNSNEQIVTCNCGNEIRGENKFFTCYMLNRINDNTSNKLQNLSKFEKAIFDVGTSTADLADKLGSVNSIEDTQDSSISLSTLYSMPVSFHIVKCDRCGSYVQLDRNTMQAIIKYHVSRIIETSNNLVRTSRTVTKPCQVNYKPDSLIEFMNNNLTDSVYNRIDFETYKKSLAKTQEDKIQILRANSSDSISILTDAYNNLEEEQKELLNSKLPIEDLLISDNLTDEEYYRCSSEILRIIYDEHNNKEIENPEKYVKDLINNFVQPEIIETPDLIEKVNKANVSEFKIEQIKDSIDLIALLEEAYKDIHNETIVNQKIHAKKVNVNVAKFKFLYSLKLLTRDAGHEQFLSSIRDKDENVCLFKLFKMHYYYMVLTNSLAVYKSYLESNIKVQTNVIDYSSVKLNEVKDVVIKQYETLYTLAVGSKDEGESFFGINEVPHNPNDLTAIEKLLTHIGSKFYFNSIDLMEKGKAYIQPFLIGNVGKILIAELVNLVEDDFNFSSISEEETALNYVTDEINWQLLYGLFLIDKMAINTNILKISNSAKGVTGDKYTSNILNYRNDSNDSFVNSETIYSINKKNNPNATSSISDSDFRLTKNLSLQIQDVCDMIFNLQYNVINGNKDSLYDYSKNMAKRTYRLVIKDFLTEALSYNNNPEVAELGINSEESLIQAIEVTDKGYYLADKNNYSNLFNNNITPASLSVLTELLKSSSYAEIYQVIQRIKNGDLTVDVDDGNIEDSDTILFTTDIDIIIKQTIWYLQHINAKFIPQWIKEYSLGDIELIN